MSNPMVQAEPLPDTAKLVERVKANDPRHKHISLSFSDSGNEVSKRLLEALKTNTVVTSLNVFIADGRTTNKAVVLSLVSLFAINHIIKHLGIITYNEEQGLPMFLEALSKLQSLSLESLALRGILRPIIARHIATLLARNHPSLTHLKFGILEDGSLDIVMAAVHRNEHIVSLALPIELRSEAEIEAVLPAGNRIEKVSLHLGNYQACLAFQRVIQLGHCGDLTSLDLTIDNYSSGSELQVVENLATIARLQDFTLRVYCYGRDTQSDRETMQRAFQSMESVTTLSLYFVGEDMSMTSCLPVITPVPPNVRKLLLSVNRRHAPATEIEDSIEDATAMISSVFRNNVALESLTLQGNKLRNNVVVAFASILPTMTNLTHLSLDCKKVHHVGGTVLLRTVKAMPNLLQVDLDNWRKSRTSSGIPADIVDDIFYTCKIRSICYTDLIANAPLSLYPKALSKLGKGKWFNVAFRVLRARSDVLIPSGKDSGGGGGISGKQKRDESS